MGTRITLLRPGVVAYDDALAMQHRIADEVRAGGDETLILLEHPPTYTFGVRGKREHLLIGADALRARGAEVVQTDRGGDVTFHGPGQIVGYPIMNIRARGIGPATYVCTLEKAMIAALRTFGIDSERIDGRPGVWTASGKVAAIGVRVSRGVTTHGFALNVNTDLAWFAHIVPCGLPDITVTSMQHIAGREFAISDVEDALVAALSHQFESDTSTTAATHRNALPLSTKMERGQGGEVTVGR